LPEFQGLKVHWEGIRDTWFSSKDQALLYAFEQGWEYLRFYYELAEARWHPDGYSIVNPLRVVDTSDVEIPRTGFLFEEPITVQERLPMSDRLAAYWKQWLVEHAYYEALNSAPTMSDNNIQNLGSLAEFIYGLVVKHEISMPRSLQDAWLSYRYEYQTTKSDVKEAIEFVGRELDLSALKSAYLTCHGEARTTYKDVEVTCRCTLKLKHREVGLLSELWFQLYKYGLQPNFYVLWDSLPFSFMVDWFIPIGDMASVADASANYCGDTFDIEDVVFSLQYTCGTSFNKKVRYYSRWVSKPLDSLNAAYWFDKPKAKGSTWNCRFLDFASLFIR
jgi:hypothetical protein